MDGSRVATVHPKITSRLTIDHSFTIHHSRIALVLRFMTVAFDFHQDTGSLSPFFKNHLSNFLVKLAIATGDHSFIIYGDKAADSDLPGNVSLQPGRFPGEGSWLTRLFVKPGASAALLF